MRKRTRSREFALQILYQINITGDNHNIALDNFFKTHSIGNEVSDRAQSEEEIDEAIKSFTAELIKGVVDNLSLIDGKISLYAANWELERMAIVDRNILRLGCFELLFRDDIPPKVSINEAVELAKRYSGSEAGKFVNAILDKINLEKNR